jgi:hypothetical protein
MWLYVGLVAVVCAAVPATVWLKRAGDRVWLEHVLGHKPQRQVTVTLVADVEPFVRAMRQVGAAVSEMAVEMRRTAGPFEKFGRDMDGLLKRILPPMCPQCGPGYRLGDEGCRHGGRP